MNRKEILKKAHDNAKNNFWMYLAVVILTGLASGVFSGGFDTFSSINKLMSMLRSGMLSQQNLLSPDSEFYRIISTDGIMSGGFGIFGLAAIAFISNPLSVGANKFFLNSVESTPLISTIAEPFKNNYLNTVLVMFLRDLLMTVILFGISLLYLIVVMLSAGLLVILNSFAPVLAVAGTVAAGIIMLAALVGYVVWTIYISYNFSFIGYILSEHPDYNFTMAYNQNKRIVHGKKLEIFKADFHYVKWLILSVLVPIALFAVGFVKIITVGSGIVYIVAGLFLIVPILFISLFLEVFRSALQAHIYSAIRFPEPTPDTGEHHNFYETPSPCEPISYSDDDNNENNENTENDENDENSENL